MTDTSIENLTIAQKATIPKYREKCRAIALAPGPIDRDKAAEAIESVCAALGQSPPKIFFLITLTGLCDKGIGKLRIRRELGNIDLDV